LIVAVTDYPFLEILGTMILFFAWLAWFSVVINVLADIFRRHDLSGWGKAGWALMVVVIPFLGILIYLGTQGGEMAERNASYARARKAEFVREGAGGSAGEIAQAKELLDAGTIDQTEFDQLKRAALG
jgi:hypothetical protein